MVLNILGGVVSGVWLVVLKDWGAIGTGIFLFLISTFLLGIALVPSLLLVAPAIAFAEKGKTFGVVFFGVLSSLYICILVTLWCCGIFFLFVKGAAENTYIPRLVWSYGIATAPWSYMASKDEDSGAEAFGSSFTVFFAQLGYLVIMLVTAIFGMTLVQAIGVFGSFMLVALVVQSTVTVLIQREQRSFQGR
jgi:hypothetical protein